MVVRAPSSPICVYCKSERTAQLIPDRFPFSPVECLDCGAVFGSDRTDGGLLQAFGHGPLQSIKRDALDEKCVRCDKDLSDYSVERLISENGQICEDCTIESDWE